MAAVPEPMWKRALSPWRPTASYCMETEVHVYALSIGASALLSFFPFMIVMVSLCEYVFRLPAATQAIYLALADYFPGELGEFVQRNLRATVESRGPLQLTSIFLLLFTANGVFEPLEVALNRAWGVRRNRSYVRNQVLSLGLIFLCGGLALASFMLTAVNTQFLDGAFGRTALGAPAHLRVALFKAAAVPLSILALFFAYWLLPNRRIPARRAAATAILVGLVLEGLKYVNIVVWPFLNAKLTKEYGPFRYSASIVLLAFVASMIVLAGAEWSARGRREAQETAGILIRHRDEKLDEDR
jgi:YihY family inner membrane protein